MKYTIRKIETPDFEELILLFQEFAHFEKLPDKMTNTVQQMKGEAEFVHGFVVINSNNKIVGYVTYFYSYYTWIGKSMYMDDLYVTQKYRGKGIGTALINAVIEKAEVENCKKLRWQVSEWNKPAIEFYKKLGAEINEVESNCDLVI